MSIGKDAEMREHNGEENGSMDLSRADVGEILQNIIGNQSVSSTQKMKHLHNFVKLLCRVGLQEDELGLKHQELIICVRLSLLSDSMEVRAAGLRALRYLISDRSILDKVLALNVDYLITRCIDIQDSNKTEKTQALRLVRKMMAVNASVFPSSITNSLMALGSEGSQEADDMVRPCIAIICELSLLNPAVVAQSSGLSAILKNVIGCRLNSMNESLIATVLHLFNHPDTRQYVRSDVELEQILVPYTDFHYRLTPDIGEEHLKENRDARFLASKMSIIATFRSWSGIVTLCKSGNSGIQSLIDLLCIPNTEVRRALLEVIYEVFLLDVPVETTDFTEALISVDPGRHQQGWRLTEGFIVSEALVILPQRSRSRPNLIDNYLAFLLSAFIHSRLLEGLVELITSSDDFISIQATVLLGQLLNMANSILPHCHSHHLHCLPRLMNMAACSAVPRAHRQQARAAVTNLKLFHERTRQGPSPHSLYLDHVLRRAAGAAAPPHGSLALPHRPLPRDMFPMKENDDALLANLRDSHVLHHDENLDWNWELVQTILKWPNVKLQSNRDDHIHKFVRRLLWFFMPSSKLFVSMKPDHPRARQTTVVGCELIEFLLDSEEEGDVYLEDLVKDIVQWLHSSIGPKAGSSSSSSALHGNGLLLTTLSQYYFLFLGTLSAHRHGVKVLEKGSVYQCLLSLCMQRNQDHVVKLTVSTLDFSRDGLARVVLSKVLIAASESCRLYATRHLRVLLRANAEFFSNWGVELLVTQLYDRSQPVRLEALDVLDEACEDKANLHALVELKPALTHLGDKGKLLLLRFLSIPKGFSYLEDRGFITGELERWHKKYNLKYVDLMEEQLNEALTTYRRPVLNRSNPGRSSAPRAQRPAVYPLVHLYGQLVHDKAGCQLLEAQNVLQDLSSVVRSPDLDKWEGIKTLKAALWALGNIGSTNWGVNLLLEEGVVPEVVALAQHCEVLSVRGTCLYTLGMLGKTRRGCDVLKQQGWDAVCHSSLTPWPLVPQEVGLQTQACDALPPPLRMRRPQSVSPRSRRYSEGSQPPGRHGDVFVPDDDQGRDGRGPRPRSAPHHHQTPRMTITGPSGAPPQPLEGPMTGPTAGPSQDPLWTAQEELPFGGSEGTCLLPWAVEPEVPGDPRERGEGDRSITAMTDISVMGSTESAPASVQGLQPMTSTATTTATATATAQIDVLQTPQPGPPRSLSALQLSGSGSTSPAPPGPSSHRLTRHTKSLKGTSAPGTRLGNFTRSSSTSSSPSSPWGYRTPRTPLLARSASLRQSSSLDALGYATLRRLQQQRIQPLLGPGRALAPPANEALFADAIAMTTGRPGGRFTSQRFGRTLRFATLDQEDLLSPINHDTLQRSSSLRAMATADSAGGLHGDNYIGIALPVDITNMLHIKPIPYFQKTLSPPAEDLFNDETSDHEPGPVHQEGVDSKLSSTELHATEPQSPPRPVDTGLQEHTDDNCLYCSGLSVLGLKSQNCGPDLVDELLFSEWCSTSSPHLEARLLGVSGTTLSQGSAGSGHGAELVLGVKAIPENGPSSGVLLRKEVLRLVVNLSSSVGTKGNESSLLRIKEKFPHAFDDVCLYSDISNLMAHHTFGLHARRFIQELFQDVSFLPLYEEAESVLSTRENSS
ncbi:rapamycin-insensitive companion of mTOR isoform X2 [Gadus morhua]|uniref:rapamycin-insensitive companion of mTOR isoform X2 n=1 Tax=Gadus morhua TaxID=8049 RepID=UPI0011B41AC8|nr:rapamycin-insensitive companion of mTOR-like isoform X2 [Gadus morhua]